MGDLLDFLLWISGALVFVGGGSLLALSLAPTAAELAADSPDGQGCQEAGGWPPRLARGGDASGSGY